MDKCGLSSATENKAASDYLKTIYDDLNSVRPDLSPDQITSILFTFSPDILIALKEYLRGLK